MCNIGYSTRGKYISPLPPKSTHILAKQLRRKKFISPSGGDSFSSRPVGSNNTAAIHAFSTTAFNSLLCLPRYLHDGGLFLLLLLIFIVARPFITLRAITIIIFTITTESAPLPFSLCIAYICVYIMREGARSCVHTATSLAGGLLSAKLRVVTYTCVYIYIYISTTTTTTRFNGCRGDRRALARHLAFALSHTRGWRARS